MAKLTEKSTEVFEYVKNAGGKVSIPELCEALNRAPRSVGANVTDLTKKGLAERQKEKDGEEEVTYVALVPGWEAAFDALEDKLESTRSLNLGLLNRSPKFLQNL